MRETRPAGQGEQAKPTSFHGVLLHRLAFGIKPGSQQTTEIRFSSPLVIRAICKRPALRIIDLDQTEGKIDLCESSSNSPPHLLADADGAERHSWVATDGQRRGLHHLAAIADDRGADQGDREPSQAGVRRQLSGCRVVPWVGWRADLAANVRDGADAPVEPLPINLLRLTDTVCNAVQPAGGELWSYLLFINNKSVATRHG